MPVFNERSTVEAAIEDALERRASGREPRARRRRRRLDRRHARAARARARGPTNVEVVLPRAEPRQGRRRAHRAPARDAGVRRDPRRRPRVPRSRPRRRARAARLRRGSRRLRHARVDVAVVVQLLVRDGEQGGHDGDERPLQLLDLRRHDLPQGDADGALPLAARCASAASRSSRRSPRACCAPASGSTRCRSRTGRAPARPARSSPPSTASACCERSCAAASLDALAASSAAYAVLGTVLCWSRLVGLTHGYWCDEILTVSDYVDAGPRAILAGPYIPNNHELFSMLGWVTTSLGADSEAALRLWSVLPFLLGVALVTTWLHRRVGALSGMLFLFLATASPLLLDISRRRAATAWRSWR